MTIVLFFEVVGPQEFSCSSPSTLTPLKSGHPFRSLPGFSSHREGEYTPSRFASGKSGGDEVLIGVDRMRPCETRSLIGRFLSPCGDCGATRMQLGVGGNRCRFGSDKRGTAYSFHFPISRCSWWWCRVWWLVLLALTFFGCGRIVAECSHAFSSLLCYRDPLIIFVGSMLLARFPASESSLLIGVLHSEKPMSSCLLLRDRCSSSRANPVISGVVSPQPALSCARETILRGCQNKNIVLCPWSVSRDSVSLLVHWISTWRATQGGAQDATHPCNAPRMSMPYR